MALKRTKKLCKRCARNFTTNKIGYCDDCLALFGKDKYGREETRTSSTERGYDWKWRQFSKSFLQRNPTCVMCGAPATITDHKVPIQIMREVWGDNIWDENYYQPLCVACNTKKGLTEDKRMLEVWEEKKKEMKNLL